LIHYGSLEVGVVQPFAEHVKQVEIDVIVPPGCADAIVIELAGLIRSVPALQLGGEALGKRTSLVVTYPALLPAPCGGETELAEIQGGSAFPYNSGLRQLRSDSD
jgi:hypothetical protein